MRLRQHSSAIRCLRSPALQEISGTPFAALRQLGFRGRVVAAVLGLTENYVATLWNAAKRDGSAAPIRQDRPAAPGKVTAAQWEQARAWRDQGVSDAEIGRRLGLAHTTISRGLGPRGAGAGPDGEAGRGAGSAPCQHLSDQHHQPQRQERRNGPARSEPVRTWAPRAPPHGHPRQPNRHHTRNRAPA